MRALITGVGGFVGRHLLAHLQEQGDDVYGLGRSERLLGRLLREVGRDGLIISSKVGYFAGSGPHPYHPDQMRHQLNTTLANLGTDRVTHLAEPSVGLGFRF